MFIDEFNISVKLKNHLFMDACLHKRSSSFFCGELILEVCPRILNTLSLELGDGIIGEQCIGMDLEGRGCGLISSAMLVFFLKS